MRFRSGWLLLVAGALVAGACGLGETAETSLTPTATTTTPNTGALTPTTTTSFSTADASSSIWFRVPHDEAVLGGEDIQEMASVTVGGPGLVASEATGRCLTILMRSCGSLLMGSPGPGFPTKRLSSVEKVAKICQV